MFSYFVPYYALRHPNSHAGVAMISIAYLLSYGVVPAVTIAMVKIQWDGFTNEGTAQPLIYFVSLGLLVSMSTIASAVAAFVILRRQKSGLYSDPGIVAGLGTLVAGSDLLQKIPVAPLFRDIGRHRQSSWGSKIWSVTYRCFASYKLGRSNSSYWCNKGQGVAVRCQ
jgi:hypothetical protein